jgi:hypothetical protein
MLNSNLSFKDLMPDALALHEARYQERLKSIPAPGCGQDCHPFLLGVASLGIKAGRSHDAILADIRTAIPTGGRRVPDHEIMAAIKRASLDTVPAGSDPAARPIVEIDRRKRLSKTEAAKERERVLSYSSGPVELDSAEFRHAHGFQLEPQPIMPLYPEAFTMIQLISELYALDDPLYIGSEYMEDSGKDNICPAGEWIERFKGQQQMILERIGNGGWTSSEPSAFLMELGLMCSHIVPNSVTGCLGKKKDGGLSLRCDGSIRTFKYGVIDFDGIKKLEEHGEVIHCLCEATGIRICALIQTGGREGCGLHAWVRIDGVKTLSDWNKIVRDGLFPTFEALGADPACANPSRGSRLPGVFRCETGRWQKLLFVSREGVRV